MDLPEMKIYNVQKLYHTEWSFRFEKLMRNRLTLGALRYGRIREASKPKYNRLAAMRKKLEEYVLTGNDELLVDIANLSLLEFEEGAHPKKHFHSKHDIDHVQEVK